MELNRDFIEALPYAAVGAAEGAWKYYKPSPAVSAWAALAVGITAYDAWAITTDHETMSHAFHRAYEHPILKYACIGALGGLALHLLHKP